jgi:hypothetical protein
MTTEEPAVATPHPRPLRRPVAVVGRARRDPGRFPRVDSYADALNPDGSEPGTGSGDPPG